MRTKSPCKQESLKKTCHWKESNKWWARTQTQKRLRKGLEDNSSNRKGNSLKNSNSSRSNLSRETLASFSSQATARKGKPASFLTTWKIFHVSSFMQQGLVRAGTVASFPTKFWTKERSWSSCKQMNSFWWISTEKQEPPTWVTILLTTWTKSKRMLSN